MTISQYVPQFPGVTFSPIGEAWPGGYNTGGDLAFAPNVVPGFVRNGDFVVLPTTSTGSLVYKNAAGTTQWTKAVTDINAACDHWCAFIQAGASIVVIALDAGTTPATFYTAFVNSAGTVTNKGNAQPAADFVGSVLWPAGNLGSYLPSDNQLELYSDADEIMTIQTGTGAITADPAYLFGGADYGVSPSYRTANGVYVGRVSRSSLAQGSKLNIGVPGKGTAINIGVPWATLAVNSGDCSPVRWGNYVVLADASTNALERGWRLFNVASFDAEVEKIAARYGWL